MNKCKDCERETTCKIRKGSHKYCFKAKNKEEFMSLTGNEYQKFAMRTCSIDNKVDMLYHGVFGLNSEAGEVAGLLQKMYQGHNIDEEHLKKELGDCMWFIAEICTASNISLDDVMQTNIDKLKARYPDGFDVERSLHRKENDI